MLFFCGWLVIHANRIKANRNSLVWCIKHKNKNTESSEERECEEQNIELKEINQNEEQNCDKVETVVNNRLIKKKSINSCLSALYNFVEAYWTKLYKSFLYKKAGKFIVLGLFFIYITFFGWNASKIREGINLGDLVSDNSYYRAYITDNVESFNLFPIIMIVINEPVDYTNKNVRNKINNFLADAKKIEGVNPKVELNWMKIYEDVLNDYKKSNKSDDQILLTRIRDDILPFSNDVVFEFNNKTKNYEIVASRYFLQFDYLKFNSEDAVPMNNLRSLCQQFEYSVIPYAISFKFYEQF